MMRAMPIPWLLLALLLWGCSALPAAPVAPAPPPVAAEDQSHTPTSPEPAEGITLEEAKQVPVLPPSAVKVAIDGSQVALEWQGTGASLSHYEVIYRLAEGSTWQRIGSVVARAQNVGAYQWKGELPADARPETIGVVAIDTRGVASEVSLPLPDSSAR